MTVDAEAANQAGGDEAHMHFCQFCNVYVHVSAVVDHEMGSTHQDKV